MFWSFLAGVFFGAIGLLMFAIVIAGEDDDR